MLSLRQCVGNGLDVHGILCGVSEEGYSPHFVTKGAEVCPLRLGQAGDGLPALESHMQAPVCFLDVLMAEHDAAAEVVFGNIWCHPSESVALGGHGVAEAVHPRVGLVLTCGMLGSKGHLLQLPGLSPLLPQQHSQM